MGRRAAAFLFALILLFCFSACNPKDEIHSGEKSLEAVAITELERRILTETLGENQIFTGYAALTQNQKEVYIRKASEKFNVDITFGEDGNPLFSYKGLTAYPGEWKTGDALEIVFQPSSGVLLFTAYGTTKFYAMLSECGANETMEAIEAFRTGGYSDGIFYEDSTVISWSGTLSEGVKAFITYKTKVLLIRAEF